MSKQTPPVSCTGWSTEDVYQYAKDCETKWLASLRTIAKLQHELGRLPQIEPGE